MLILQFVVLALMIIAAGIYLTRCAEKIGAATKLGRSIAGLVLLAGATSLPELSVDCSAAMIGAANLAVGDLFGSSLFNLLILGVADMLHRSQNRMFSSVSAAHAITATTSIALTAMALLAILLPWRPVWMHVGLDSILIFIVYLMAFRLIFLDQQASAKLEKKELAKLDRPNHLRNAIFGYLVATLIIFVTGSSLAIIADKIAEESGLGGTFIGTTLVALTTSLPEMVTTIVAVRLGAFEMAVGNIFGSNCFNMAALLPIDFFYRSGPLLGNVVLNHAITAAAVIVVTATATIGLLYRAEKKYWLVEPDAALIVMLVLGTLTLVFFVPTL